MFTPAAQRFFKQLARNNTKTWFDANRAVYETEIRGPFKALVEEIDVCLARIAPEIVGDPKRSLFRINRDIRFSKDKSPYKTNAGCWFFHQDASRSVGQDADAGSAGFYFHLDATRSFLAGGIWMPPRGSLAKIRDAIVAKPREFERLLQSLKRRFGSLDAESKLTRVPRGYPADHVAADWLRYQSFTLGRPVSSTDLLSPKLPTKLARDLAALTPFVRWLNGALGLRTLGAR